MSLRRIQVHCPNTDALVLDIERGFDWDSDAGAFTRLSIAEAEVLRDSLALALRIHSNQRLVERGREVLAARNAGRAADCNGMSRHLAAPTEGAAA